MQDNLALLQWFYCYIHDNIGNYNSSNSNNSKQIGNVGIGMNMNNMCNSNSNSNFNNNNSNNNINPTNQHIPSSYNHNNIKKIKIKATDKLNFQLPIPDKSNKMDIE